MKIAMYTQRIFKGASLNSLIALLVLVVLFVNAIPTGATGSTDNGKGAMPAPLRKWGNGGAMGLWGRKRSASLVGMDAYYDEAPANERIWASNVWRYPCEVIIRPRMLYPFRTVCRWRWPNAPRTRGTS